MSKPLIIQYTGKYANHLLREKEKEIERLNNIIKEARKYIEEHTSKSDGMLIGVMNNDTKKELLEILDKENK